MKGGIGNYVYSIFSKLLGRGSAFTQYPVNYWDPGSVFTRYPVNYWDLDLSVLNIHKKIGTLDPSLLDIQWTSRGNIQNLMKYKKIQ